MDPLRIAVVGAGTAGAAAAILLARAGHAVALFERVALPGPVGAGITLQPTGQAVLARLGLLDQITARATRIDGLLCRRSDGRAVVDLRYADVDPALCGYGLHRGVLFEALFAAARAEPRIAVHCGVAIASTALDGGGRWLVGDEGARHGPFDLVVAADARRAPPPAGAPRRDRCGAGQLGITRADSRCGSGAGIYSDASTRCCDLTAQATGSSPRVRKRRRGASELLKLLIEAGRMAGM